MRKALIIGINKYDRCELFGCVNDAKHVKNLLIENEDKSHNFDIMELINENATADNIISAIEDLYKNDDELTILYFSGHGYDNHNDGAIVCVDNKPLGFQTLMNYVQNAKSKYNVIILDCCYSGKLANYYQIGDKTILPNNTVILTACRPEEPAIDNLEVNHGTFTNLLIGALNGGASDILGRITPGSIYSYIDQALGSWEQRPYFKANVSSFVSLRNANPRIELAELKEGLSLFINPSHLLRLDPSYEETNVKGNRQHAAIKPYAKKENVLKMKLLQKMNQNGLVIPTSEKYMYYAAMNNSYVGLTELGKHYWNLYKNNRI